MPDDGTMYVVLRSRGEGADGEIWEEVTKFSDRESAEQVKEQLDAINEKAAVEPRPPLVAHDH